MSRSANLSPLGLYQWDNTILDLLELPEQLDRDTLIDNLLMETAELEVRYPNPTVFKNLVGIWSNKCVNTWEKLYATTQYEYNPIENYDRRETASDDVIDHVTHSGTDSTTDNETHSGTDRSTDSTAHTGGDTTTGSSTKGHWIAGFNSTGSGDNDGLVKQTRDEDSTSGAITYGNLLESSGSLTHGEAVYHAVNLAHGENIHTTTEKDHEMRAHGNIGVTTTQEMIKQEREVDMFNLYDIIIADFKAKFCILVY